MRIRIDSTDKFYIQSICRALTLVEVIGNAGESGISLTALSEAATLPVSTVYRILQNLKSWQYIQESRDGRYRLGLELITLGNMAGRSIGLKNTARPFLEELGNLTRETIYLAVLDEDNADVMYIDKVESKGNIKLAAGIGSRNCIHSTANGKVLVSGLSNVRIRELLEISGMPSRTNSTITDINAFLTEIEGVRMQGYAMDNIENEPGVRCIAAPVFGGLGSIIGSISLSCISAADTADLVEKKYKGQVIETANKVSIEMGHNTMSANHS